LREGREEVMGVVSFIGNWKDKSVLMLGYGHRMSMVKWGNHKGYGAKACEGGKQK